ncbi:hypothetical protein [Bradyrhizobium sp. McL0615]|uniref:hypothetical protein n=1 Tax=Bradyrhizobium sp. McL0615 TaxID=3415673 RepID=UPI003CF69E4F
MSLAEGPPDLPYPKLPFWDTVSLSYSTYFRHFIDALRASWLWLIVAAVVTGFASWQQWSWMATMLANLKPGLPLKMSRPSEMALLLNLDNILLLFAGVSIAVAWHRLMILNEQPGFSGGNVATKDLWRYIVMALALFLVMFLPMAAVMFPTLYLLQPVPGPAPPPPALFLLLPLLFALYAVGTFVAFRLTLLLPAQAIGDTSLTFKQAWNRTRGNVWRLFWGVVVTTMPALLIAQVVFLVGVGPPRPSTVVSEDFVAQMTAMSTVFAVYYLLILPIGIGFLSHAYRHFFVAPLELP